jgi:putative lipoprotein
VIRGTVSYLPRIALANKATVTVKLVDVSVADAPAEVIAEETFNTNGRQVPIPFELRYDQSRIDSRRSYALQAEIRTDGKLGFRTDRTYGVLTRGNPTNNVELVLVQASESAPITAITGQTLSLSKFGTGSIQVEGRNSTLLIRANVNVKTDGNAEVTVAGITGGVIFSGKLTSFDQTTLRITVEKSGNADASGEIEVKYNGRRLDSIVGNNLVLDGQKVTLRF